MRVMSDKSAKLLMRVAEAIEVKSKCQPQVKMSGTYDVPCDTKLVQEITDWARGYRKNQPEELGFWFKRIEFSQEDLAPGEGGEQSLKRPEAPSPVHPKESDEKMS